MGSFPGQTRSAGTRMAELSEI